MYALGALITALFFLTVFFLVFNPIPQGNGDVLYLIIGALIGYMGAVVQYFYGSSMGSADKNDLLKNKPPEK